MKKTSLLSSLLIASTLTLGACEYPQDVPVLDKAKSQKLKEQAQNKKTTKGKRIYFSNDSGASYTLDKQVEAMEIIAVALGQFNDTAAQYSVTKAEPKKTDEGQLQEFSIQAKTNISFDAKIGGQVAAGKIQGAKTWNVAVLTTESGIVSIEATAGKSRLSVDMPNGQVKNYVNLGEESTVVRVKSSAKPGLLDVTVEANGSMSGNILGVGITKDTFSMKLSFNVNENFLSSSQIALMQTSGFFKKSDKLQHLNTRVAANTMSLELGSQCSQLLGQATVNNGTMTLETDYVIPSAGRKSPRLPCGQRSVINMISVFWFVR